MVDNPVENPIAPPGAGDKLRLPEIFLAIALGISAIATAYAAFRASLLGDDMIANYQEGIRNVDQASQAYTEANQFFAVDQAVFLEFVNATQGGDNDLAVYIKQDLMTKELSKAVDAWLETDLRTPFEDESIYYLDGWRQGDQLDQQAQQRFDAAAEADKESDRFELVTVIMAAVLFFFGMGSIVERRAIKLGFIGAGSVFFVTALGILAVLTFG